MSTIEFTKGQKVRILEIDEHYYYAIPLEMDWKILEARHDVKEAYPNARISNTASPLLYSHHPDYPANICWAICEGGKSTGKVCRTSDKLIEVLTTGKIEAKHVKPNKMGTLTEIAGIAGIKIPPGMEGKAIKLEIAVGPDGVKIENVGPYRGLKPVTPEAAVQVSKVANEKASPLQKAVRWAKGLFGK